jgi:hypothetical protein
MRVSFPRFFFYSEAGSIDIENVPRPHYRYVASEMNSEEILDAPLRQFKVVKVHIDAGRFVLSVDDLKWVPGIRRDENCAFPYPFNVCFRHLFDFPCRRS